MAGISVALCYASCDWLWWEWAGFKSCFIYIGQEALGHREKQITEGVRKVSEGWCRVLREDNSESCFYCFFSYRTGRPKIKHLSKMLCHVTRPDAVVMEI